MLPWSSQICSRVGSSVKLKFGLHLSNFFGVKFDTLSEFVHSASQENFLLNSVLFELNESLRKLRPILDSIQWPIIHWPPNFLLSLYGRRNHLIIDLLTSTISGLHRVLLWSIRRRYLQHVSIPSIVHWLQTWVPWWLKENGWALTGLIQHHDWLVHWHNCIWHLRKMLVVIHGAHWWIIKWRCWPHEFILPLR